MGNIGGRQRPHVALDDVLFLIAQGKHSLRIIARDARVLEAVPMGDVAAVVPVIQVKVMQERTFYKAGLIGVGPQMDVEPECDAGHPHTVFIGRDAAVLDEFLHLQRVRVIGNPFQKNVHTDFFFRGQFADHSNSSTRAAVSSRSAVPSTTRIGQHSAFCHVSCRAALLDRSLGSKFRVGGQPEIIVGVEKGKAEFLRQVSSQRRRSGAKGTVNVDK